ncbi:MAG: aspartate aminotransferase family protein [Bacillota bacterium]
MSAEKAILSPTGIPRNELFAEMRRLKEQDADWKGGKTWSLVYYGGEEITSILEEAYLLYFHGNALNPMAFPGLRRFETEVISMAAGMLGGDDAVTGSMTSGGTESILMAVKTARDLARARHPELEAPEMVLPLSVHPAFLKAAHYLGVKPVRTPIRDDFRAEVQAVRQAVTPRTVLVVGSAPSYPQGVIDPIEELAAIALENDICCHVDSCLGGFILPFIAKLGYPVPPFDFRVPGVTSISADIHKYGFAAKGASVVLYRNEAIRRHQYFALADWPGGLFGSPSMTGTRPGGAIAAAWAIMKYLGEAGYRKLAGGIMETTRKLKEGIAAVPGLYILGRPEMSVFAFGSDTIDIHLLADAMEERGWHMDRQQKPPCLHVMVTPAHAPVADQFLADLRDSAVVVESGGCTPSGMAAMYGLAGTVPPGDVENFILDYLNELFSTK